MKEQNLLDCAQVHEEHDENCLAVKQEKWDHPWSQVPWTLEYGDKRGPSESHSVEWWIIPCLDPDCSGKLAVNARELVDIIVGVQMDDPVFITLPCENCGDKIFGDIREYVDGGYGFDAYCEKCKNEDGLTLQEEIERRFVARELPDEAVEQLIDLNRITQGDNTER